MLSTVRDTGCRAVGSRVQSCVFLVDATGVTVLTPLLWPSSTSFNEGTMVKLTNLECEFWFSQQLLPNFTVLIPNTSQSYSRGYGSEVVAVLRELAERCT